jgi:hypothetical protein
LIILYFFVFVMTNVILLLLFNILLMCEILKYNYNSLYYGIRIR